jgi:hypothetical protein
MQQLNEMKMENLYFRVPIGWCRWFCGRESDLPKNWPARLTVMACEGPVGKQAATSSHRPGRGGRALGFLAWGW